MGQCVLQETTIDAAGDFKDTVTRKYLATFDSPISNEYTALATAQSMGPNPLPARRAQLAGTNIFANNIRGSHLSEKGTLWVFDVTFSPPPDGEDEEQQNENPLLRPAVFNVDYRDEEYVVKKARNVENFGQVFGGAPDRPAGTLGPITNSLGKRPDEPIVRTRRVGVIVIEKNLPDLGAILDRNEDYQDTANSDEIVLGTKTFSARRLKFEVCRSLGKQIENGVTFYPSVTEIGIYKTTDLTFDNVGYDYFDLAEQDIVRATDNDGNDLAEPTNLELTGVPRPIDAAPLQITYRDLEEVAYADFFTT